MEVNKAQDDDKKESKIPDQESDQVQQKEKKVKVTLPEQSNAI